MSETAADYGLLAVFVTVAQEGSFTKAAQKLGVGKGTVSRGIAALEAQLGTELVHRTTRAVALSTAGTALYERTAQHLAALDHAVQKLPERAAEPSGLLRITAPHDFAFVVLAEVVARFALRYPDVQVDLRTTNTVLDLVAAGIDVAIRGVTQMKDSTLTIRRLGIGMGGWYAAPSYLARRGKPKEVGDPRHEWILHGGLRAALKIPANAPCRFLSDDFLLSRSLAREGAGVCLLPAFAAAPYVRDGWLEAVPLAPEPNAVKSDLALLYPSSGQVPRKVTAFCEFVLDWAKTFRAST